MPWRTRPILVWMALVALMTLFTGCAKPLFPESGARSQFVPYDRLHGEYVPQKEPDRYGRQRPNLRRRLQQR